MHLGLQPSLAGFARATDGMHSAAITIAIATDLPAPEWYSSQVPAEWLSDLPSPSNPTGCLSWIRNCPLKMSY